MLILNLVVFLTHYTFARYNVAIMRIQDSNIIDSVKDVHVTKEGIYYFFDKFIIGEINKDVVYDWKSAQSAINAGMEFYGREKFLNITYISNRVNEYSVKPIDWLKFFKSDYNMKAYAIVSYSDKGFMNGAIEELFMKIGNFKRFTKLEDAINWVENSKTEAA